MTDGSDNVVSINPLMQAIRDMERMFDCDEAGVSLDAALAIAAQRYEAHGAGVFDSAGEADFYPETVNASKRLHQALQSRLHRNRVKMHTRIWRTFYSLDVRHRCVLRVAFTPRRWSALETMPYPLELESTRKWVRVDDRGHAIEKRDKKGAPGVPPNEKRLRIMLSLRRAPHPGTRGEGIPAATLVDLAIESGVATQVHAEKMKAKEPPPAHGLLCWMLELAEHSIRDDRGAQRRAEATRTLEEIRERTGNLLMPSLKVYDDARKLYLDREAAEDAARPTRLMDQWQKKPTESRRLRRIVDQFGEDGWAALKEALGEPVE